MHSIRSAEAKSLRGAASMCNARGHNDFDELNEEISMRPASSKQTLMEPIPSSFVHFRNSILLPGPRLPR
jgi:hypothetical protein